MYESYKKYLQELQAKGRYRKLGLSRQGNTPDFLDFSTNDYLQFSTKQTFIQAAEIYGKQYGIGSTGSRLLSGNLSLYEEFEKTIATDKHTESSLIFHSGFQVNISTLSSLLDEKVLKEKPLVFFDKYNHSSLYEGLFLSKAELRRYPHNHMDHLETLLKEEKNNHRPKFIVTETVFGMDGDRVPLEHLVQIANQYNAYLYLDEAHATGIFGPHGYGLSTTVQLQKIPHILMGTLSKALGCSGGYIACSHILHRFFINKAKGFMYSSAPSPPVLGAAFEAWKSLKFMEKERQKLLHLGTVLRNKLKQEGFDTGLSCTHIVPVILKEEDICLKVQKNLFKKNILVSCVRPPTVPFGTSRLRIALTTKHEYKDLETLVEALKKAIL